MYPHTLKRKTSSKARLWSPDYLSNSVLEDALAKACMQLRGRVLDVGCGNRPYASFLLNATDYLGYDFDFLQTRPHVAGSAESLPFASAMFDGVLSTQVLEHIREPARVLGEIARVLRPGGRIVLSAPQAWRLHEQPHDYYRYTRYGLAHLVQQAGLNLLECLPQGGTWRLVGQIINNYLWQRRYPKMTWQWGLSRMVSVSVGTLVNVGLSLLDKIAYDPEDTINYVVIAESPVV